MTSSQDPLNAYIQEDIFQNRKHRTQQNTQNIKLEHSGTHGTFLDIGIHIEDGIFVYKLFDKRHKIPFFIARMLHFESNILSAIFYSSIFSEFSRIARCTLKFEHFLPRASEVYSRIILQGSKSKLYQEVDSKIFSKISRFTKKLWQKL